MKLQFGERESMNSFPAIQVDSAGDGYNGMAGIALVSILKAELLSPAAFAQGEGADSLATSKTASWQKITLRREAFVRALSGWPSSVTIELHLTALPHLATRPKGQVLCTFFLRYRAQTREKVMEELASLYMAFMPLLTAHFPEIEFAPVTGREDLAARYLPFRPSSAAAIHRRNEKVSLALPLAQNTISGFGPRTESDGGEVPSVTHRFPFQASQADGEFLFPLLMGQWDPLTIIVRLRTQASFWQACEKIEKNIAACERALSDLQRPEVTLARQVQGLLSASLKNRNDLREAALNIGVYILGARPVDPTVASAVAASVSRPLSAHSDENGREAVSFSGGAAISSVLPSRVVEPDFFFDSEPYTVPEAASAFHPPAASASEGTGLPVKRFRTFLCNVAPPPDFDRAAVRLFRNEHQGLGQDIHLSTKERYQHVFVVGQTGTGKSHFLKTMLLQDIEAGQGVGLIDPHGECVDDVLSRIPREREKDVILFDMADSEHPIGFNILEWHSLQDRDRIVDDLYQTIDYLYDMQRTGGPIFESNFRGMLRLLLGDKKRGSFIPTLLDLPRCYLEENFRNWLKNDVNDPMIKDFVAELERTGGEASLNNLAPYVTSKLSRFYQDTTVRRIVGQGRTTFDFDEIVQEGKIFLFKMRSEERRVGKECRSRWSPYH